MLLMMARSLYTAASWTWTPMTKENLHPFLVSCSLVFLFFFAFVWHGQMGSSGNEGLTSPVASLGQIWADKPWAAELLNAPVSQAALRVLVRSADAL